MELMGEGVKYQTKGSWYLTISLNWLINIDHLQANAIFGYLRLKYKEAEEDTEENIARREKDIPKSMLAKERSNLDIALLNNEGLRKDLDKVKKELETIKATHRVITDINVDLFPKNEILTKKNEDLAESNQSLAKQNNNIHAKEVGYIALRQKLWRGTPITSGPWELGSATDRRYL